MSMKQTDYRRLSNMARDAEALAKAADAAVAAAKLTWQADVTITYNTLLALNLAPP